VALVLPRHAHSHPAMGVHKPTPEEGEQLNRALDAVGVLGVTTQTVINGACYFTMLTMPLMTKCESAPTTRQIYGDRSIAEVAPALQDKRRVRDTLRKKKQVAFPHGTGWEGIYARTMPCFV
jgi:hypothetical protein